MGRKPIPKSVRFEVFKRDKFTCQYCGQFAPVVILEVDHIKPVSKGGTNDIINLITSCRECNRGKRNKSLSDNSAVVIQKKQLDEIQERREQIEMMVKWREALENELEIEVDAVDCYIQNNSKWGLSEDGRLNAKKLIKRFGFSEVYAACEIAFDRYYKGSEQSLDNAWNKVGGICYNRKKAREENAEQDS